MYSFQEQILKIYKQLSEFKWQLQKFEKEFYCEPCISIKKCIGITKNGDVTKFLNEKGDFIEISPSLDCEDIKECIGITPTGAVNKFLNEQGDYVVVSGSGFACSDLNTCSTTNLPEGDNLYFTNTRAITALTGQNISIFNNDSGYITNAALAPYLTSATAAATYYPLTNPSNYIALTALSAGTGINYNNLTGVITNTAPNLPDYIQSISDTNTIDLDVTANNLTANVRKQNSSTINLSDDASGLKADLATGAAAANLGFTPENVANKATNFTTINNTLYPTTQAVSDLIGNPITHLNIFTHLTEFTAGSTTGNFFISGNTVQSLSGWVIRKDGTNASAAIQAAESGRNGILRLGTGTTSTGAFRLTAQNIWLGGQSFVYECPIRVQTLSTGAQDYYISIGFTVGSVLTPTDALRVFYNHATNSGNFVCERTAGGITSTINTTVALVVDTWFTIRIVKYSNGTVEFFINGVSMGAASSVNAPTGASLTLGFFLSKTAGTTERTCDLDYAYYKET
jgi:hypothetical protein